MDLTKYQFAPSTRFTDVHTSAHIGHTRWKHVPTLVWRKLCQLVLGGGGRRGEENLLPHTQTIKNTEKLRQSCCDPTTTSAAAIRLVNPTRRIEPKSTMFAGTAHARRRGDKISGRRKCASRQILDDDRHCRPTDFKRWLTRFPSFWPCECTRKQNSTIAHTILTLKNPTNSRMSPAVSHRRQQYRPGSEAEIGESSRHGASGA